MITSGSLDTAARDHEAHCFVTHAAGGLIRPEWCSVHFVDAMRSLPEDLAPGDYARPELVLHSEGPLEVYFTPFDRVNRDGKVVLVGLTPGRQQAHLALTTAAASLRAGATLDVALEAASRKGSFAGAMRRNIATMLDGVGLHTHLGLASCAELFSERSDLLAGTSAICYPVFIDGANYAGTPPIFRSPILRAFASQVLAADLAAVPDALVVPLGRAAEDGVALSGIDPSRVLSGFPHPSGANGHRVKHYAAARDQLTDSVRAWFSS